ncbi:12846_t:CDS:1 [Funneliformis geosporum]|uniref:10188_t:CDS:1 n=1 Tax=Funneliformis geosporum TaxID=1117311 RepID=A0A9W4SKM0_9GLOM|nr:10188_t:CDS:1 [Funneliformis geosporum]CAI2175085.1 12846_t:CDS:1 [Funneliformis geosporum]
MKAQDIYRMEEINIDDRKEILSVEQQILQPISPKDDEPAHSSNDDREFEREHNYQRTREENTTQLQQEKQNEITDQNEQSLAYESEPIERNIQDTYERNSRYSDKHKNGKKNYNRKRIRSNSDRSENSYYSQPSEELQMGATPPPPAPPHPDLVSTPNRPAAIAELKTSLHHHHRPRTPMYEPGIPSSWHSNNRMSRKDYFTDDRKKNRMRYRNRDFNHERMHLFDRIQIKDRNRGPERERDYEIVDRKERYERERGLRIEREHEIRERDVVRPRDNPTRYYEESHPRFRVPYYEYGREADRIRAPYFDYHREPDFREREYPRYRDFDWDPYYHRASPPPPGHFHYRENLKRPNDYFYQQTIYPRRSLSPRARYSPNTRRLTNPTYERRYERDRPPRYDSVRENEFDARRDSIHYNASHYNELHSPGFDHYNPPAISQSPINIKSSYEDNGFAGVVSTVNESSYERERPSKPRNWDINADKGNKEGKRGQSNSNDITGGGYERERGRGRERRKLWDEITHDKPKDVDVDNHSNSTIVSTTGNANNNSSSQDHSRDRIRNEKSRNLNSNDDKYNNINTDHNSGDANKEPFERHATREKSNNYWDKNEEKSRDFDRNITKNRERDNWDNKERGNFDQTFSYQI